MLRCIRRLWAAALWASWSELSKFRMILCLVGGFQLLYGLLALRLYVQVVIGLRWTPTLMADLSLRAGEHGDRFLPWSKGLSVKKLKQAPHGIYLGPLRPGLRVFHEDRRVDLAPRAIVEDLERLARELEA